MARRSIILKIIYLLCLLFLPLPFHAIPGQQLIIERVSITSTARLQQDFPELNFTEQSNDIVETILDILWDVDGDQSFSGFLPLIYSYIPGLGENGNTFLEVFFLLSLTVGVVALVHKIRQARGG